MIREDVIESGANGDAAGDGLDAQQRLPRGPLPVSNGKQLTPVPDYGRPGRRQAIHLLVVGALLAAGGMAVTRFAPDISLWWVVSLVSIVTHGDLLFLFLAGLLSVALRRRVRDRDRLLDRIDWRGDEFVLDVGCGEGFMSIAAAKHLTTGRVVGIDDFRSIHGRPSFTAEAAMNNARLEGVTNRVDFRTGDCAAIELADQSCDLVLASFALHHLGKTRRAAALGEMARVLKPGGRLVLVDLGFTRHIATTLRARGLTDVIRLSQTFPRFMYRWVFARKPAAREQSTTSRATTG